MIFSRLTDVFALNNTKALLVITLLNLLAIKSFAQDNTQCADSSKLAFIPENHKGTMMKDLICQLPTSYYPSTSFNISNLGTGNALSKYENPVYTLVLSRNTNYLISMAYNYGSHHAMTPWFGITDAKGINKNMKNNLVAKLLPEGGYLQLEFTPPKTGVYYLFFNYDQVSTGTDHEKFKGYALLSYERKEG